MLLEDEDENVELEHLWSTKAMLDEKGEMRLDRHSFDVEMSCDSLSQE